MNSCKEPSNEHVDLLMPGGSMDFHDEICQVSLGGVGSVMPLRQALFLCNICVVFKAVVPIFPVACADFDIAKVLVSFSAFIFL